MLQAAALLRCGDQPLWTRIAHFVGQARARDDLRDVTNVGTDDTSMHRGQSYITVAHDLVEKRLLFATNGRDHQILPRFSTVSTADLTCRSFLRVSFATP